MNLLLFGGSGFVSGRVLRFALAAGHKVTAVTRGEQPFPETISFRHIKADRNESDLGALADENDFDAVLDVICQTPTNAAQALDLARHCKRVIMVSSDYAYDPATRKLAMTEAEARFSEREDYGGNKHRAEQVLFSGFAAGTCLPTILRPPHIYGPGSNPGTIPQHGRHPNLLDDIKEGKPLHLLHGGLGLIQPIHADDLAQIILAVVDIKKSHGEDYTTCGAELMTHLDYYRTLASCIDREITHTAYCPSPDATDVNPYVSGHRYYNRSKLDALLPSFTYTSFEAGMREWASHLQTSTPS